MNAPKTTLISTAECRARLEKLTANVNAAARAISEARQLVWEGIGDQREVESARAVYAAAVQKVKTYKIALAHAELREATAEVAEYQVAVDKAQLAADLAGSNNQGDAFGCSDSWASIRLEGLQEGQAAAIARLSQAHAGLRALRRELGI